MPDLKEDDLRLTFSTINGAQGMASCLCPFLYPRSSCSPGSRAGERGYRAV